MVRLNHLFRKRIGFPENQDIHFENLENLLVRTARTIPFENLCIINKRHRPLSEENLIVKTLEQNEGGLCYELNSILYLFLKENGFQVSIVHGVVFNPEAQKWSSTGRTHAAIILKHEDKRYLIDTGFGGNLPLKPVPLNGDEVISENGEFRVSRTVNTFGDMLFEMKRRDKDVDWIIGYVFDSQYEIKNLSQLEEMQKIIIGREDSPFNKAPLITMLTENGSMTLTKSSFTVWHDGKMTKEDINDEKFRVLAKEYFGLKV